MNFLIFFFVISRDIAARNCLLTRNYHIKLSDFGMSNEKTPIQDKSLDKVRRKFIFIFISFVVLSKILNMLVFFLFILLFQLFNYLKFFFYFVISIILIALSFSLLLPKGGNFCLI